MVLVRSELRLHMCFFVRVLVVNGVVTVSWLRMCEPNPDPDKLFRCRGVIHGQAHVDATVQVLQAFRSCDPPASRGCYEAHAVIARPWDVGLRRVASLS